MYSIKLCKNSKDTSFIDKLKNNLYFTMPLWIFTLVFYSVFKVCEEMCGFV